MVDKTIKRTLEKNIFGNIANVVKLAISGTRERKLSSSSKSPISWNSKDIC
jgi:hypothetical protein